MATSAKTLSHEKPKPVAEDWTVVLPRRGKQKRDFHKIIESELQKPGQSWSPIDLQSDPESESKLMQKMQSYIQKLESSQFYQALICQIQSPEMSDHFRRVLGTEEKMHMVIYGIGSIESYEPPRLQLSLAILIKRKFTWIGDVEVFDPVVSLTESKVLSALGCSVLSFNEQGRRQASKPTLFFMPHCEAGLYNNLLQANWGVSMLNQIVLFGNSFEAYEQISSVCKNAIGGETKSISWPSGDSLRSFQFIQRQMIIFGLFIVRVGTSLAFVMMRICKLLNYTISLLQAEALACLEALRYALQPGAKRYILHHQLLCFSLAMNLWSQLLGV